mgnify:CR=1 FL=1
MKTYGDLIGSSGADTWRNNTTRPAKNTPYTSQEPGTKALAPGENLRHEAVSRVFTALARNAEMLRARTSGQALRRDRVEHHQSGVGGSFGTSALAGVAQGETIVDITSGAYPQAVWLYHGLHSGRISRFLRLVRKAKSSSDLAGFDVRSPEDVLVSGASVFPAASHQGSEVRGMPNFVAPMARVAADLPPYNGGAYSVAVASYGRSRIGVTSDAFQDLYARPGCYVQVVNGGVNNGLYRIESMTGLPHSSGTPEDSIVVSTGGLHRIEVEDVAEFVPGERVSWRRADTGGFTHPVNYGYVMYIINTTLYVLPASASEEYPIQGTDLATGVNSSTSTFKGRTNAGQVGVVDKEKTDHHTGLAGDVIWDGAGGDANIVSFTEAGEPLVLDPSVLTGELYVVSPPGFALSPQLDFSSNPLNGGDYDLECYTLTTYRERHESGGVSASAGQLEEPGASLPITELEAEALRYWQKAVLVGSQADSISPAGGVNSPAGLPATVLGETAWELELSKDGHSNDISSVALVGTTVIITNSNPKVDDLNAVITSFSAAGEPDRIVLTNVRRDPIAWNSVPGGSTNLLGGFIDTNSAISVGGSNFLVSAVVGSPRLSTLSGNQYLVGGLDDAYRNKHASEAAQRGSFYGRSIDMDDQAPIELLMPGYTDPNAPIVVRSDSDRYDILASRDRYADGPRAGASATTYDLQMQMYWDWPVYAMSGLRIGTGTNSLRTFFGETGAYATFGPDVTEKAVLDYTNDHLLIGDLNTGLTSPVPFTTDGAPSWEQALPAELDSVVRGLNRLHHGGNLPVDAAEYGEYQQGVLRYANRTGPELSQGLLIDTDVTLTFVFLSSTVTLGGTGTPVLSPGDILKVGPFTDAVVGALNRPRYAYVEVDTVGVGSFTITTPWTAGPITFTNTTLTSEWWRVTTPKDVFVPETVVVAGGVKYVIPETTHTMTAPDAAPCLYYDVTSGTFGEALRPSLRNDHVYLANVAATSLSIGTVTPIAFRPKSATEYKVVTVGLPPGKSPNLMAEDPCDFQTLGEALAAIDAWDAADSGLEGGGWEVRVVGSTTETDLTERGVTLPYKIPVDGIKIVGFEGAVMSWSVETGLLHLNEKSGVVLDGVRAEYTGSLTGSQRIVNASAEVMLITNQREGTVTGFGPVDGLRLIGCRTTGVGLMSMSEIESGAGAVVRDCVADYSDCAVRWDGSELAALNTPLLVAGCRLTQTGTDVSGDGGYAIRVKQGSDVRVLDCDIELIDVFFGALFVEWGRASALGDSDGSFVMSGVRCRATTEHVSLAGTPVITAVLNNNNGVPTAFKMSNCQVYSRRGSAIDISGTQTEYTVALSDIDVRFAPDAALLAPVVVSSVPGAQFRGVSVTQDGVVTTPNKCLFSITGPSSLLQGCSATANGDGSEALYYVDGWTSGTKGSRLESCTATLLDDKIPDGGDYPGVYYLVEAVASGCRIDGVTTSPWKAISIFLDRSTDVGFSLWGNRAQAHGCFTDGAKIVCQSPGQVVSGCDTQGGAIFAHKQCVISGNKLSKDAGGDSGDIHVWGGAGVPPGPAAEDLETVVCGNNLVGESGSTPGDIKAVRANRCSVTGNIAGNIDITGTTTLVQSGNVATIVGP